MNGALLSVWTGRHKLFENVSSVNNQITVKYYTLIYHSEAIHMNQQKEKEITIHQPPPSSIP